VVSALISAIVQPEVVAALFDALRDESWHVRTDAAEALAQLAHRPSVETSVDFPAQLAAGLKYLEQTQSPDWLPDSPQDHLFGALAAIAPGPEVN
jgi:HEAT repeat protein